MAWDFETDPEFQEKLDWMEEFVREKVEPLGLLGIHPYDVKNPRRNELVRPLQQEVKEQSFVEFERRMRVMLDRKTAEHRKTNERRAAASRNANPGPISLGAAITAALSKCVPSPPKVRR